MGLYRWYLKSRYKTTAKKGNPHVNYCQSIIVLLMCSQKAVLFDPECQVDADCSGLKGDDRGHKLSDVL